MSWWSDQLDREANTDNQKTLMNLPRLPRKGWNLELVASVQITAWTVQFGLELDPPKDWAFGIGVGPLALHLHGWRV